MVDYSLMNTLTPDPDSTANGDDHLPREVFSGHYVPVNPTPIKDPKYISHGKKFFSELGLDDSLAQTKDFIKIFSGDLSDVPFPMKKLGWATGYALSIYGTEYYHQCPFQTGNGYGDGRAISILEVNIGGQHLEMQLKGAGRTPYCRGADGRAVLRSSVREFLAQEHMHSLGIPTSRSLCLFTSNSEKVMRPWFNEGSHSKNPEVMIEESVAITTRVAHSFLRVGQLELFGRRAYKNEHPTALEELRKIVLHLIDREYKDVIDVHLPIEEKVVLLATEFRNRLTSLVTNWIRVGYCQGNFNSDNCAAGGFTLDYGPFGFMEVFDPKFQPWTNGGDHFSYFNQPQAAERNFQMFCKAIKPILNSNDFAVNKLEEIENGFLQEMKVKLEKMWATKLGLINFDELLFKELIMLMFQTQVDYTIFFRELSSFPENITPLIKSFYSDVNTDQNILKKWSEWLDKWKLHIHKFNPADINAKSIESREKLSEQMKKVNPKFILREWIVVSAYKEAARGEYRLIEELQDVMTNPYDEHSLEIEAKYYKQKSAGFFNIAGISHVSCSS